MNMNELAQELCALEGLEKQVDIAQIKEILRNLSMMMIFDPLIVATMIKNGDKNIEKERLD